VMAMSFGLLTYPSSGREAACRIPPIVVTR
jgi:hypothetical protein